MNPYRSLAERPDDTPKHKKSWWMKLREWFIARWNSRDSEVYQPPTGLIEEMRIYYLEAKRTMELDAFRRQQETNDAKWTRLLKDFEKLPVRCDRCTRDLGEDGHDDFHDSSRRPPAAPPKQLPPPRKIIG